MTLLWCFRKCFTSHPKSKDRYCQHKHTHYHDHQNQDVQRSHMQATEMAQRTNSSSREAQKRDHNTIASRPARTAISTGNSSAAYGYSVSGGDCGGSGGHGGGGGC
jgi:hypothetical protein